MKRGGSGRPLAARKRTKASGSGNISTLFDFESDEEVQHTSNTKKTAVVDKSSESSGDDDSLYSDGDKDDEM